jgi:hypothetical protein
MKSCYDSYQTFKREFFVLAIFCGSKLCREFRQLVLFGVTSFFATATASAIVIAISASFSVYCLISAVLCSDSFVSFSGRCFQRRQPPFHASVYI